MKYLSILLIISFLSCRKDSEPSKMKADPPTVSIATSSVMLNGIARPQFSVTFNIPDTAAVNRFLLYVRSTFPYSLPLEISKPKTGTVTLIDMNNTYPPANKTYFSFFVMADFSNVTNAAFDVN